MRIRITSYNVCYTKLLRDREHVDRQECREPAGVAPGLGGLRPGFPEPFLGPVKGPGEHRELRVHPGEHVPLGRLAEEVPEESYNFV